MQGTAGYNDMNLTKTGPGVTSTVVDSAAVTKRLQQELTSIMCGGDSGVSAFPSGDSLFNWIGTIAVRTALL